VDPTKTSTIEDTSTTIMLVGNLYKPNRNYYLAPIVLNLFLLKMNCNSLDPSRSLIDSDLYDGECRPKVCRARSVHPNQVYAWISLPERDFDGSLRERYLVC
jgi:hypothetical protein